VGSRNEVSLQVNLASASTTVEVVAGGGGTQVETQSSELSQVVNSQQVAQLPSLTRNPYDFAALSGNVAEDSQNPNLVPPRGANGLAINGQRASSTDILLDGAENVNLYTASVGQQVPLDSVQEFRVTTSSFAAEYGRASGGVVNVATKAGGNSLHGSAYDFNRLSALASNTYDNNANGVAKSPFTRNQFGYSVGGPIVKNKLFFFNSTEWTRVRSVTTITSLVPTAAFLANTSAATRNFFSKYNLSQPINGRTLTKGDIDDLGITNPGGAFSALPSGLPVFGQVIQDIPGNAGGGNPQNTYELVGRADWNLSDKTQVYGRYALQDQAFPEGVVSVSPYEGFNTGVSTFNNNFLVSLTRTFSPRWVTQSKVAFNRLRTDSPLGDQPVGPTLYFLARAAAIGQDFIALPGYLPFTPGAAIPAGGPLNQLQFNQDVNYLRGKHAFRFGGQYVYNQTNRTFGAFQNSVETLSTTVGKGLDNLLLGKLFQFQGAIDPKGKFPGDTVALPATPPNFSRSFRYHEWAAYFNDAWKVHPRVTLNLGLRYEYYGVQHNSNPRLDSNFYLGAGSNQFEQIQNGKVFIAEDSPVGGFWKPDKNNFAPRVGFAWDVFGDGNTSLRGGYGMAYERNFGNVTFNVIQNPPNYAVVSIVAGTDVPSIDITPDNAGPLAGTGSKLLPRTSLRAVNENIVNAYAHLWSAAIERRVFGGVASLEYSGSAGRKLYDLTDPNRPGTANVYLGVPCDPAQGNCVTRLNAQYSNLNTRGNLGFSNYNGMTLGYETPFIRKLGLQVTARYTWAHTIDNISTTFSEAANNNNLGLLDPFNPGLDKGNADFDIRHRFFGSWVWQLPFYNNQDGIVGKLLGGWSVNGLFQANSGAPFTIFDCTNSQTGTCVRASLTGTQNTSGSNNPAPDPSAANTFQYLPITGLTPGFFVNPKTGNSDYGPFPSNMTARNAFRGPGFYQLDTSLLKTFRITETKSIQLRGEFFNVLNHANLFLVNNNTDISGTAYIPATRGLPTTGVPERRNVQLAAKFIF
jgi:TonB dependent receptor